MVIGMPSAVDATIKSFGFLVRARISMRLLLLFLRIFAKRDSAPNKWTERSDCTDELIRVCMIPRGVI